MKEDDKPKMVEAKKGKKKDKKKKPKPKTEKGKGIKEVTYVKFKVTFQCSKDECNHVWVSAHGWREEVFCEFCESKCKITAVKDENMELDNYQCSKGHRWQSMHEDTESQQECEECGEMGTKDGSQIRFGRHFWYKCSLKTCTVEWEDFSLTPQRTQRCAKYARAPGGGRSLAGLRIRCGGRGNIVKVERLSKKRRSKAAGVNNENEAERVKGEDPAQIQRSSGGGSSRGGFGRHNMNFCDMCQDLKQEGFRGTCMKYKKVMCEIVETGEESYNERITDAVGA